MINILTRTSERPFEFERLYKSIKGQKNNTLRYRHIVCYENDEDLTYLKKYEDIDYFKTDRREIYEKYLSLNFMLNVNNPNCFIHNLYVNELMDEVKEGYIIIIDDDDLLYNDKTFDVIEEIINEIDEDTVAFVQMVHPNSRRIPHISKIKQKEVVRGDIGAPCVIFNSKYVSDDLRWEGWRAADFQFIKKLSEKAIKQKWYEKPIVQVLDSGNQYEKLKKF